QRGPHWACTGWRPIEARKELGLLKGVEHIGLPLNRSSSAQYPRKRSIQPSALKSPFVSPEVSRLQAMGDHDEYQDEPIGPSTSASRGQQDAMPKTRPSPVSDAIPGRRQLPWRMWTLASDSTPSR